MSSRTSPQGNDNAQTKKLPKPNKVSSLRSHLLDRLTPQCLFALSQSLLCLIDRFVSRASASAQIVNRSRTSHHARGPNVTDHLTVSQSLRFIIYFMLSPRVPGRSCLACGVTPWANITSRARPPAPASPRIGLFVS